MMILDMKGILHTTIEPASQTTMLNFSQIQSQKSERTRELSTTSTTGDHFTTWQNSVDLRKNTTMQSNHFLHMTANAHIHTTGTEFIDYQEQNINTIVQKHKLAHTQIPIVQSGPEFKTQSIVDNEERMSHALHNTHDIRKSHISQNLNETILQKTPQKNNVDFREIHK
jgi:hypothetical protein